MTVMISGVALVAALGVVAAFATWLVVAMFRVGRGQPAALSGEAAGSEPDQPE